MLGEFVGEVQNLVQDMLGQIHTAIPGTIVSFDAASCTATVLPVMKLKKTNGELLDYPKISGVPVLLPQTAGQKATIAMPVRAGDGCLIICAEQALDTWMYDRNTGTDLKFDLSNAIAIVGLFAAANAYMAEACSLNAVILAKDNSKVVIKDNGIEITGDVLLKGNLKIEGESLSAGDIMSTGISLIKHTHNGVPVDQ